MPHLPYGYPVLSYRMDAGGVNYELCVADLDGDMASAAPGDDSIIPPFPPSHLPTEGGPNRPETSFVPRTTEDSMAKDKKHSAKSKGTLA